MNGSPETLLEAVRYFSAPQICFETMLAVKWPDGKITCPKCGCERVGVIKSRRMLQCKTAACRKQFSVKVGTIFEDSPLGLDKWFVAVWCVADAKNGISSCELGRALGVTQKTAWFMLHRVRLAMKTKTFRKLAGEVEADETFIGGKSENMHKWKRAKRILGRGAVGRRRGFHGNQMTKKPDGLDAFERLLRPLAQVPKKEVDRQVRMRKKAARKRAKRKD